MQKFTDDPLIECPACHGRLRKLFNSVGIVFKGSGFYRTDSRGTSKASSGAAEKPAESKTSEAKTQAKTESSSATSSSSTSAASTGSTVKAASA